MIVNDSDAYVSVSEQTVESGESDHPSHSQLQTARAKSVKSDNRPRAYNQRTRTKGNKAGGEQVKRSKMYQRRVIEEMATFNTRCSCSEKCLFKFTMADIVEKRILEEEKGYDKSLEDLIHKLRAQKESLAALTPNYKYMKYNVDGKEVCRLAFQKIHGYADHKMKAASAVVNGRGKASIPVSRHYFDKGLRERETTAWMDQWLYDYYNDHGDTTSNYDEPNGKGHWYMPAFVDVKDMYREMRALFEENEMNLESEWNKLRDQGDRQGPYKRRPPPSEAHFRAFNKRHYSHVVQPTKSTYGVCEVCARLCNAKRSAVACYATDPNQLKNIYAELRAHRAMFVCARQQMRERINYARTNSSELGMGYTVDF